MRFIYKSAFAPHITGLIQQKRSDGFLYNGEEYILKNFDDFCLLRFPKTTSITHDLASEWSVIRNTEGKNYRRRRVAVLRQLCLYILSLGLDAYVPHNSFSIDKPMQYVPSREEMLGFFKELNDWENSAANDFRYIRKYAVMFRLYYCCGLRLSEVRLLKREHIDLDKGILTILQSKGRKDRLIYLPQDGITMLAEYLCYIKMKLPSSPWLFPGQSADKPLAAYTINRTFSKCWNRLPFAENTDKKPSPHCLRHAFVVERINDWMESGIELQTMLPYLSNYLGHASPSETFYYYHLVSKAFAVVKQKDTVSSRVIPEVMTYDEA